MILTLAQYFNGYNLTHFSELTTDLIKNATDTVAKFNLLEAEALKAGIKLLVHPITHNPFTSGWRPKLVNAATPNAAPFSNHMTCQAGDRYDPHGELDEWALENPKILASIGLWQEHPSATKGWAHFQTVPQNSFKRTGLRYFYP